MLCEYPVVKVTLLRTWVGVNVGVSDENCAEERNMSIGLSAVFRKNFEFFTRLAQNFISENSSHIVSHFRNNKI